MVCYVSNTHLYFFMLLKNGWRKTATLEKTTNSIKQDQSLQNYHCSSNGSSWAFLSLQNSTPSERCVCVVADISHLWGLVCCVMDFGPISKMAANCAGNLPWSTFIKVYPCPSLSHRWLDLSVQADELNTGRVYTGSGKIRVGYISRSDKIRVGCISVLRVSDQSNGFREPFLGYFFFC